MTAQPFGVSTFRLLIPTKIVQEDEMARVFVETPGNLTVCIDDTLIPIPIPIPTPGKQDATVVI